MNENTKFYFTVTFLSFSLQIFANLDSIPPYYQKRVQLSEDFDKVLNISNTKKGGNIFCGGAWSIDYSRDAILMKTNTYGEVEWAKRIGTYDTIPTPYGQNYAEAFNIATELPDETIIGVGSLNSVIIFQDSSVTNVCRFSKDGELLWSKGFHEPQWYRPFGRSVVPLPSGNFLVVLDWVASGTGADIMIAEITLAGELVWSKRYINDDNFLTHKRDDLIITENGLYLTIYVTNKIVFGSRGKVGLMHVGLDGEFKWCKYFDWDGDDDPSTGVNQTSGKAVADGFLIGASRIVQTNNQDAFEEARAFLLKVDTSGTLQWAKAYRDTTFYIVEAIHSIEYNERTGSTYVSFSQREPIDDLVIGPHFADHPEEDYLIAEMDEDGNILWHRRFGLPNPVFDNAALLNLTPDGGIFAAGYVCSWDWEGCDFYYLKTTADGYAGTCQESDLEIFTSEETFTSYDLDVYTIDWETLHDLDYMPVEDFDYQVTDLCPLVLPDLMIADSEITANCFNAVTVSAVIRNNGEVAVDGFPITIYDASPTDDTAQIVWNNWVDAIIEAGEEIVFSLELPITTADTYYVVLNDAGDLPRPYQIAQLPPDDLYEMTFENNFHAITITPLPLLETNLMIELTAGDSLVVGNNIYFEAGNYTDTLVAFNGCDSIVRLDLTVLSSITSNFLHTLQWRTFPNPIQDEVHLSFFLSQAKNASIDLISVHGQYIRSLLPTQHLPAGQQHLTEDLAALAAGVYFLAIRIGEEVETIRIVKV